jgi:large subunit ribosomal protein L21
VSAHLSAPVRGAARTLSTLHNARSIYSRLINGSSSRPISNTRCDASSATSAVVATSDLEAVPLISEKDSKNVAEQINKELRPGGTTSRLFAVIHAAGKQRKVTVEDLVILDKPIDADIGDRIRLNKVLLVGGKNFTMIGRPILSASQAFVEATVIEKTLSHGKIMFWYHRRNNFKVFKLRKDQHTVLRINNIELSPVRTT